MVVKRYSGASAARVWGSIYWENLRGYQDNACMEKRILFRLLSGLHSSIMTQIANQYRFDGEDGREQGKKKSCQPLPVFLLSAGKHFSPEYVYTLGTYDTFAFISFLFCLVVFLARSISSPEERLELKIVAFMLQRGIAAAAAAWQSTTPVHRGRKGAQQNVAQHHSFFCRGMAVAHARNRPEHLMNSFATEDVPLSWTLRKFLKLLLR